NDRQAMIQAFQLIFNEIASDLLARTRPSVTNYLDYEEKSGQYRMFSGVKVGGSVYWKGLLNRQLLECSFDPASEEAISESEMRMLHEEINRLRLAKRDDTVALMADEGVERDRRRIFTTFPSYLRGGDNLSEGVSADNFFTFSY